MTRDELEKELKFAYKCGYEDRGVRDYDFHQHHYTLLYDFESRTCDNCKHFTADYSIDPNMHFGWCNNKESCCVDVICTLSFSCNKWEAKDENK